MVLALGTRLGLPAGAARPDVDSRITGHVLAEGELVATYQRALPVPASEPNRRLSGIVTVGESHRARASTAARWGDIVVVGRGRAVDPVEVESLGQDRCADEPGSDHPQLLALYLGILDADFETVGAPELVVALRKLTGRYQRAIDASQQASG